MSTQVWLHSVINGVCLQHKWYHLWLCLRCWPTTTLHLATGGLHSNIDWWKCHTQSQCVTWIAFIVFVALNTRWVNESMNWWQCHAVSISCRASARPILRRVYEPHKVISVSVISFSCSGRKKFETIPWFISGRSLSYSWLFHSWQFLHPNCGYVNFHADTFRYLIRSVSFYAVSIVRFSCVLAPVFVTVKKLVQSLIVVFQLMSQWLDDYITPGLRNSYQNKALVILPVKKRLHLPSNTKMSQYFSIAVTESKASPTR